MNSEHIEKLLKELNEINVKEIMMGKNVFWKNYKITRDKVSFDEIHEDEFYREDAPYRYSAKISFVLEVVINEDKDFNPVIFESLEDKEKFIKILNQILMLVKVNGYAY